MWLWDNQKDKEGITLNFVQAGHNVQSSATSDDFPYFQSGHPIHTTQCCSVVYNLYQILNLL